MSVRERSLWAKTQQVQCVCVCASFVICACTVRTACASCVCVFVLTPSAGSGAPAKTKQVHKLRKLKRSLRIKGGLVKSSALPRTSSQIPRKPGARHVARIHTHVYDSLCLFRAQRAKKRGSYFVFPFISAASLLVWIQLTFKLLGVIRSQWLNNGQEFPLWVSNNGACCSLSLNGCTHCLALIVRTGSSPWRKQEVDTWRLLGLLF